MTDIYKSVADQPERDEEDELRDAAKAIVATDPDPIPDAVGLPDDVPDGDPSEGD